MFLLLQLGGQFRQIFERLQIVLAEHRGLQTDETGVVAFTVHVSEEAMAGHHHEIHINADLSPVPRRAGESAFLPRHSHSKPPSDRSRHARGSHRLGHIRPLHRR